MAEHTPYPIGTPGQPWGDQERAQWLDMQNIQRSYADEVLAKIEVLSDRFVVTQYGALSADSARYPLFAARSQQWQDGRDTLLVTGGVHGYETSGVQGALRFLATKAATLAERVNVVVAPCVSPWGYETINRWNAAALDPNRSFVDSSPSEEAAALMQFVRSIGSPIRVHVDLHETTDTDNSEFRPALAARDAKHQSVWDIPDGFYTVGDAGRPEPGFQKAVIEAVAQVTHIAEPDGNGTIIGEIPRQRGVIDYAAVPLGLCMGMTDAQFVTTTEVYPDSPRVDDDNCIEAQVAAVMGGYQYFLSQSSS